MSLDVHSLAELRQLLNGRYGQRKPQFRVDGVRKLVELDTQPDDVGEVHQLCSCLKRDVNYQQHIMYIDCDCFVVEYL